MAYGRALAVATLTAALALGAIACGDDETASTRPGTATGGASAPPAAPPPPPAATMAPPPAPQPGLPAFTAGFEDGVRLNRRPLPPSAGAPHGEAKNVYVDRPRAEVAAVAAGRRAYAPGTVVVKTGSRGGDEAAVVAVMRKIAGRDPGHGDWVFVEYSRSAPGEPYTELARGAVCWGCHVQARDVDWVFTTLE